jgi:Zn-dependent protease with chaperone function
MTKKMTKKERKQLDRVRALLEEIVAHTGLGWWSITLGSKRGKIGKAAHGSTVPMAIRSDWRYRTAYITVSLPALKQMSDEQLTEAVWHELMHIFLNQLGERKYSDAEELTATTLAYAFTCWTAYLKEKQAK